MLPEMVTAWKIGAVLASIALGCSSQELPDFGVEEHALTVTALSVSPTAP